MVEFIKIKYDYTTTPNSNAKYRKFYHNHVKKNFVKWCAYKGLLDDKFSKQEIKKAQIRGTLPKGYNIHHIHPLSGAGNQYIESQKPNDFNNLCIISEKLHTYINRHYFEPQIKKEKEFLTVPKLPTVATSEELYNQIRFATEGILPPHISRKYTGRR